ncbi:MAG: hypothetical protein IBX71_07790 [Candidatus Desulforudis sp.]|nr:hypothetical protein [Desulforudis sp.]
MADEDHKKVGGEEVRPAAGGETRLTCAACPAGRAMLLPRVVGRAVEELLPVPVSRHLRNARRETLLAARGMLNHLLEREEARDRTTGTAKAKKIEIE